MRAMRAHEYGPAATLSLDEVEVPSPSLGQVLVAVAAAGVNPVDLGSLSGFLGQPLPMTPGWDLSGTVTAVGPGTETELQPGTEVYGMLPLTGRGAYAEYVLAYPEHLSRKPARIDHVSAAAVPLSVLTAWQLVERSGLGEGTRVLVFGATGGVGGFAIQLARLRGAHVTAVTDDAGGEFVKDLGAGATAAPFGPWPQSDVVLDTVGGVTQADAWAAVAPGGTMLSTKSDPLETKPADREAAGAVIFVEPDGKMLARVASLIDEGALRVSLDRVLPLEAASAAHDHLRRRGRRGKTVLAVR